MTLTYLMLRHDDFMPAVRTLRESGARFVTLSGVLLDSGEVEVSYFFEKGEQVQTLITRTEDKAVPSLFSFYGAADFPEREAARAFGVRFLGHPNLPRGEER